MLGPSWVALLRKIPAILQDTLVMLTATGTEIMVQKILVMEDDYLVFRGRMSGVQDGGMVLIMPYDQISNLAFNKRMLEPEVRQIFGDSHWTAVVDTPSTAATDAAKDAAKEEGNDPRADVPIASPVMPATEKKEPTQSVKVAGPENPTKNTLLARLRARLAGDGDARQSN